MNANEAAVAAPQKSSPSLGAVRSLIDPRLKAAAEYVGGLHGAERQRALKQLQLIVPPDDGARRFEFVDLGLLAAGGLQPPDVLHNGVIVEGRINWLSGHPGHGKTTLAMYIAVEHMEAGGHVLWIDWENGQLSATRRLIAVGAKLDQLAKGPEQRFHYVPFPTLAADSSGFEPIRAALEDYPGALVVFDSASKALSTAGISEDSNEDATKWTTSIVMPTREAGATVIVIDHVPKSATRHTPYPRGAGAKLADTDVHWYVEASERFDRQTAGVLRLTNHKDREGVLAPELWFRVGDGEGNLPITPMDAADDSGRSGLRAAIIAALQEHAPDAEHAISQSQAVGLVPFNQHAVRAELRVLADDPSQPVRVRPGDRNSLLYSFEQVQQSGLAAAI